MTKIADGGHVQCVLLALDVVESASVEAKNGAIASFYPDLHAIKDFQVLKMR